MANIVTVDYPFKSHYSRYISAMTRTAK